MAWIGVITNAGDLLINQYMLGGEALNVTRLKTGTGVVDQEDMFYSTDLAIPVSEGIVSGIEPIEGGTRFRLAVGPYEDAYMLRELGIFAKIGDGPETLLALIQHSDTGIAIPDAESFPDFVLRLSAPLAIKNKNGINIYVDPTAFVPFGEFELLRKRVEVIEDVGFYVDGEGFVCHRISTDIPDPEEVSAS